MGCNESKHDVVTNNSVTKKQKQQSQPPLSKKSSVFFRNNKDDLEITPPDENKNSIGTQVHNHLDNDEEFVGNMSVIKDITINTELKKESNGGGGGGNEDEFVKKLDSKEDGRLLVCSSSPDHYFSSRRNDDVVSAIVAEEEEEDEFEYHSPVHELVKDGGKLVENCEEEEKKDVLMNEKITNQTYHNAKQEDN